MDYKEAINKIKALFNAEPATPAAAPTVTTTDYPLADGKTASIDKLEVGGMVMIDGVPAPDGDITLADGTVITVASGVITVVTPVTPADAGGEMKSQEEMMAYLNKFAAPEEGATPADPVKFAQILKTLFEKVFRWELQDAKDKAAIAQYQNGFKKQEETIANQQAILTELFTLVETLAGQETAAPAELPVDWEKMTSLERYRAAKAEFKN